MPITKLSWWTTVLPMRRPALFLLVSAAAARVGPRWALDEIGGFDPIFMKAGDDVDVCWRLEQAGFKIGFSPAALVWHYRRSTIPAYLGQQSGYGEAEALLVRKHPEYFNSFGGSLW